MNWTEVNIYTTTEGIDPVCGCLLRIGVTGFVIKDANDFEEFLQNKEGNWDYIDDDLMGLRDCETTITAYLPENSQGMDYLAAIKSELVALKGRDINNEFGRLEYELANVKEEDWANNWKQYFKPIEVGDKLLIKPSWEEISPNEQRKILEIDPASSFGTGQHNTTRLCLELIEKYMQSGDRVLDLGCGSGILSIGALLLGGKECVAVDIEENAVTTSIENAKKNNISEDIYKAYCGNIIGDVELREKIGTGYDVICANIVADVLKAMAPIFKSFLVDNGLLIVSGIITERREEVIECIKEYGFEEIEGADKEGWSAVALRAKN